MRPRVATCAVFGLGLALLRCGASANDAHPSAGAGGSEAGQGGAGGAGTGVSGGGTAGRTVAVAGAESAGAPSVAMAGEGGAAGSGVGGVGGEAGAGGALAVETLSFVSDKQVMPADGQSFAVDLDGDGLPDNAYGRLAADLVSFKFGVQLHADDDIAAGLGLQLLSLGVPGSNLAQSAAVSLDLVRATTQAMPIFDGTGAFTPDKEAPNASLLGAIKAGVFATAPLALGSIPQRALLHLQFGTPVDLPVQLFSVSFHVAANGLTMGQLNGAILKTDLDAKVPPALAAAFNAFCTAQTLPNQTCIQYLALFDADQDGTISADEVRASGLIKSVLAPDVKLFDATGKLAPNPNAKPADRDAFSVGIGFTAVTAAITP